MKYKFYLFEIFMFTLLLLLQLGVATRSMYKSYYSYTENPVYATVNSPYGGYTVTIKYEYVHPYFEPVGTFVTILCNSIRGGITETVEYISFWDYNFDEKKNPQKHYQMDWTEKGLSIIVPEYEHKPDLQYESKEDYFYVPARTYELDWNRIF